MSSSPAVTAVLTSRRDAGGGLRLVTLTPPPEIARAYHAPGQYIEVRAPSGTGYFALAGDTGAPSWEVLVRNNGDASDALTTAPEGTVFELAGPLGAGFPVERGHGRPLVLAVVGSALAVSRPIMRERLLRGDAGATTLYVGARTAMDVPLAPELLEWVRAGARVVLCLSRPDLDDVRVLPEVTRRRGWVQRVLADPSERSAIGLVFAAGPFDMLGELRALAEGDRALEVVTNV